MKPAPIPSTEPARLAALAACQVLDTGPEAEFDDLTRLAAELCRVPMAMVSLVDRTRQWFKSRVGVEASETPRNWSFCAHTVLGHEPLIVEDALLDADFRTSPLVTGEPRIRFYAGVPLVLRDGHAVGALCVVDRVPRQLSPAQLDTLVALARQVTSQLELRRASHELADARDFERTLLDNVDALVVSLDGRGRIQTFNRAADRVLGYRRAEPPDRPFWDTFLPADRRAEARLRFPRRAGRWRPGAIR